ncbi:hypothetical protein [Haloarcula sp. JP-L23]|uniref:hypothetical protein n=1 Tax=Haloarcula sp. JP-L23 TaxID=2716717 RepID=UPI001878B155
MMYTFEVSDRLYEAAERWGEKMMQDIDEALETKVEQSLLEIEHLVSQSHEVEFDLEGRAVTYDPTDELAAFLERQADGRDLDESDVLKMHVDLYANAFLEEAASEERPPNAPPTE